MLLDTLFGHARFPQSSSASSAVHIPISVILLSSAFRHKQSPRMFAGRDFPSFIFLPKVFASKIMRVVARRALDTVSCHAPTE